MTAASACSWVGAMHTVRCTLTVISARSRPSRSQWAASASSLRGISAGSQMRLDSSAYCATSRRVFRSPAPPIITGMRLIGGGWLTASRTL